MSQVPRSLQGVSRRLFMSLGRASRGIAMHQHADLVAASTVTGEVGIFEYGLETNAPRALLQHHELSTRALEFSRDGSTLFMGSKDCCISAYSLDAAVLSGRMCNVHELRSSL